MIWKNLNIFLVHARVLLVLCPTARYMSQGSRCLVLLFSHEATLDTDLEAKDAHGHQQDHRGKEYQRDAHHHDPKVVRAGPGVHYSITQHHGFQVAGNNIHSEAVAGQGALGIAREDFHRQGTCVCGTWHATKGASGSVEMQPLRQGSAVSPLCEVGHGSRGSQGVAKGAGGNLVVEIAANGRLGRIFKVVQREHRSSSLEWYASRDVQ
mmetsp:Transcript_35189/g.56500  ORF Transcript_35189/g.56500 Transcript_35189/m.56500 type:complete len:209 (-) Transcript_35189:1699-2325(-)